MTTILHIGPAHSPHVYGIIRQIKEFTDFNNVIISYLNRKYINDKKFFSNVPIYVYEYRDNFHVKTAESLISKILNDEKPDIVIGHSLSEVAKILNYILVRSKIPGIGIPWGNLDFHQNLKNAGHRSTFIKNINVLKKLNFLAETNSELISLAVNNYKIEKSDFLFTGTAVPLAQYTDHIPDTSIPRILIGKDRSSSYLYECLPELFSKVTNLEVYALESPMASKLTKELGIYDKIVFHKHMLPESEFAKLIKKCNIVYTLAGDPGTGGTALQASYAGCVNIMRRCTTSKGILDDEKNAIMCESNTKDVYKKLVYSIENLDVLCKRFKENNKYLIQFDQENTWKCLYSGICDCLSGKKGKIVPKRKLK